MTALLLQEGGGRLEGLVLMASAKGVWVCRIGGDARLVMLHSLPPPSSSHAGTVIPCASWRQHHPPSTPHQCVCASCTSSCLIIHCGCSAQYSSLYSIFDAFSRCCVTKSCPCGHLHIDSKHLRKVHTLTDLQHQSQQCLPLLHSGAACLL